MCFLVVNFYEKATPAPFVTTTQDAGATSNNERGDMAMLCPSTGASTAARLRTRARQPTPRRVAGGSGDGTSLAVASSGVGQRSSTHLPGRGGGRRAAAAPAPPRASADADMIMSSDGGGAAGAKGQVVLELQVERTGTLGESNNVNTTNKSLRDFATSDAATHAMLTGGPGTPEQLTPDTWRVTAPGFGGRGQAHSHPSSMSPSLKLFISLPNNSRATYNPLNTSTPQRVLKAELYLAWCLPGNE
jgi:hypothetical protein